MKRSTLATTAMGWLTTSSLLLLSHHQAQAQSVVDVIAADPSMYLFYESLLTYPKLVALLNGTTPGEFTVFVPTDDAIRASESASAMFESYFWLGHLEVAVSNHVIPNRALNKRSLLESRENELLATAARGEAISVTSFGSTEFYGKNDVGNDMDDSLDDDFITITAADSLATNGIVHAIDRVLMPKLFETDFSMALERQPEYAGEVLSAVMEQVGGRDVLDDWVPEGRTYVGCASDAMTPDHVNQVLDSYYHSSASPHAHHEQHYDNSFVSYNVLRGNYYMWDMPTPGSATITLPEAGCGHLFITNSPTGRICFNDACVIETNTPSMSSTTGGDDDDDDDSVGAYLPRTYLASNGVGYVTDKCLVCPGVAMLLQYASSDYADFGTDDISALFQATGWDLRDLTQMVSNGAPITLFAPAQNQWATLSAEDNLKLRTDPAWKPHLLDALKSMMVPGAYRGEDLKRGYIEQGGEYQLKTLNGGSLTVGYDARNDYLLIDGTPIFVANMHGVDGMLHLTEHTPTPKSLVANLYEVGWDEPKLDEFMELMDQPHAQDLRHALENANPVTVLYVPDDVWDGVHINSDADMTSDILENHILPDIYSCEVLTQLAGTTVSSLNGAEWTIHVDADTELPCFVPASISTDPAMLSKKACITECDVVARNGIGHKMSMLLAQPGVVVVPQQAPSKAPSHHAETHHDYLDDAAAPTASPSPPVRSLDLPGCLDDLAAADYDGDGALRRHEFYHFVAAYGLRKCYEIGNALQPPQIALFRQFACQCLEQEGADEDCCDGTSAFIDLVGTVIPDQDMYKMSLCDALEQQLFDHDCNADDDSAPSPAPSQFSERTLSNDGMWY